MAGLTLFLIFGAISLQPCVKRLTDCGFGTIENRAKRPCRVVSPSTWFYDGGGCC